LYKLASGTSGFTSGHYLLFTLLPETVAVFSVLSLDIFEDSEKKFFSNFYLIFYILFNFWCKKGSKLCEVVAPILHQIYFSSSEIETNQFDWLHQTDNHSFLRKYQKKLEIFFTKNSKNIKKNPKKKNDQKNDQKKFKKQKWRFIGRNCKKNEIPIHKNNEKNISKK